MYTYTIIVVYIRAGKPVAPPRQLVGATEEHPHRKSSILYASASASAANSVAASLRREVEFTAEITASTV